MLTMERLIYDFATFVTTINGEAVTVTAEGEGIVVATSVSLVSSESRRINKTKARRTTRKGQDHRVIVDKKSFFFRETLEGMIRSRLSPGN